MLLLFFPEITILLLTSDLYVAIFCCAQVFPPVFFYSVLTLSICTGVYVPVSMCLCVCEHVSLFNHFEFFLLCSSHFSFQRQNYFCDNSKRNTDILVYTYLCNMQHLLRQIFERKKRRVELNLVFNRNICLASNFFFVEYLIYSMRNSHFSLFCLLCCSSSTLNITQIKWEFDINERKCWYFQYFLRSCSFLCCSLACFGFSFCSRYILQILFDTLCLYNVFYGRNSSFSFDHSRMEFKFFFCSFVIYSFIFFIS